MPIAPVEMAISLPEMRFVLLGMHDSPAEMVIAWSDRVICRSGRSGVTHKAEICDAMMAFSLPRLSSLSVSQARGLYQLVTFKKDLRKIPLTFTFRSSKSWTATHPVAS